MDELFGYRAELPESESATLYARLYHEYENDPLQAYSHLHETVANHYSDWRLLVLLASLLSSWATLLTNPLEDTSKSAADNADSTSDATPNNNGQTVTQSHDVIGPHRETLFEEATGLLDRVLANASEASTLRYAQQMKASILFQERNPGDAIGLLEPLVPNVDASSAIMLLAAAYKQTGSDEKAWHLLQTQRYRAISLVMAALAMEMRMTDNPAYACEAAKAGDEVYRAFDMQSQNPFLPVILRFDLADILRQSGDVDAALDELEQAVDAASKLENPKGTGAPACAFSSEPEDNPTKIDLFDHIRDALTPLAKSENDAWSEHESTQVKNLTDIVKQRAAALIKAPEWQCVANDIRYQGILRKVEKIVTL